MENFSDGEYETVVAATAYAITTLEEEVDLLKQKKAMKGLTRTKSKEEEKTDRTSFNWSFKWLSGTEAKEDERKTVLDKSVEVEKATKGNYSYRRTDDGEETDTPSTVRKMSTLNKKIPNEAGPKRLQSGKETMEGKKDSFTRKTTRISSGHKKMEKASNEQGKKETADVWEKAEMINANNRYEKMMSLISEWQNEKKTKAKRRMERKQGGPEHEQVKALQKYNNEVSRINKIAGDARALAKERKQNDEAKIREKAAKIRLTGKVPSAYCTCC